VTIAVIGATGHVGTEIVRGLLKRGEEVAALVRDHDEARRAFGEPDGLHVRQTRVDDPRDLTRAFDGIRAVLIAMGSIGIEGVLQRIAINAAAGISSIEQVTRLSVFNTSANSRGINQRAHFSIDQFASSTGVPYSTIRPAIFSLSLLAAAPELRAFRTWTVLAGSGRMALIDPGRRSAMTDLPTLQATDIVPTYLRKGDPAGRFAEYYPAWIDNLADDVTLEGSMLDGAVQGADAVRALVGGARQLYDRQDVNFAGPWGDNGFIEDYTTEVRGRPLGAVHLITFNAEGQAQHIAANYRPLSSLMLLSRLLRERFAGTPYAEQFLAGEVVAS
jgi:hypothetical protein